MKLLKLQFSKKYGQKFAMVDDEDYAELVIFKWRISSKGNVLYAYRRQYIRPLGNR